MTGSGPRRRQRLLELLAGRSRWGVLDVWPSRYGYTQYRLLVYPPGTSASERLRLRLWRAVPVLAPVAALVLLVVGDLLPRLALPVDAVAGLGGAAAVVALAARTRRVRRSVRVRAGARDESGAGPRRVGDLAAIERWGRVLAAADRALRSGEITAVEHELVWSAAWTALRRDTRRTPRPAPRPSARATGSR